LFPFTSIFPISLPFYCFVSPLPFPLLFTNFFSFSSLSPPLLYLLFCTSCTTWTLLLLSLFISV
jgi:hypothetical protein